jgi:hypothetical protein
LRTGAWLIEVRNDRFDDCVIYLIRGGTPIPLGVAAGLSHRTFRVDPALLAEGGGVVLGSGNVVAPSRASRRRSTFRRLASPAGSCGPGIASSSPSSAERR